MPIKKDLKERAVTPFTDPLFGRRSISIGDVEFQRKFEQNLIRFGGLPAQAAQSAFGGASSGASAQSGIQDLPYDTNQVLGGEGEWEDLISASGLAVRVGAASSATSRNENAAEKSTYNDSYTIVKALRINEPIKGTVQVSFYMKTDDTMIDAYGRVYLNDSPLGTAFHTTSESGEYFSQSFTVDWAEGDMVQIYAYSYGGGSMARVYDMAFGYDVAIIGFGFISLVTALPIVEQTPFSVTIADP
jgi:hypothetical protein